MANSKEADRKARRIAKHMHANERTSQAWGLQFIDAGQGWARASMLIRDDMLNGHGVAHGGMIFSLADTVFAWACNSRNVVTFAQQASISFLSKVEPGEAIMAEAREEAAIGRTGVYTVRVTGSDGRMIAIFQGLSRTGGGDVMEQEDFSE